MTQLSSIQSAPSSLPHQIGDMVYFWTHRGSHGYATIRAFQDDRILLDPVEDATKGSDYYARVNLPRGPHWIPRDYGVRIHQIDTSPNIWWKNF